MYGVQGGRSRCSPFWEELMACAQRVGRRDQWNACRVHRDDYIECLHHKKLYTRIERIKNEKERLIKEGKWPPKEEAASS
ncbi:NADH dehydrogenase [ubiquinone] iron-sulfur protein 5 [Exaiptasia diaphana]|nr:NADH dehydrogenase [ubiquinone] iron-sulfur protein 5 [Exaiptasia diaphana]